MISASVAGAGFSIAITAGAASPASKPAVSGWFGDSLPSPFPGPTISPSTTTTASVRDSGVEGVIRVVAVTGSVVFTGRGMGDSPDSRWVTGRSPDPSPASFPGGGAALSSGSSGTPGDERQIVSCSVSDFSVTAKTRQPAIKRTDQTSSVPQRSACPGTGRLTGHTFGGPDRGPKVTVSGPVTISLRTGSSGSTTVF